MASQSLNFDVISSPAIIPREAIHVCKEEESPFSHGEIGSPAVRPDPFQSDWQNGDVSRLRLIMPDHRPSLQSHWSRIFVLRASSHSRYIYGGILALSLRRALASARFYDCANNFLSRRSIFSHTMDTRVAWFTKRALSTPADLAWARVFRVDINRVENQFSVDPFLSIRYYPFRTAVGWFIARSLARLQAATVRDSDTLAPE